MSFRLFRWRGTHARRFCVDAVSKSVVSNPLVGVTLFEPRDSFPETVKKTTRAKFAKFAFKVPLSTYCNIFDDVISDGKQ